MKSWLKHEVTCKQTIRQHFEEFIYKNNIKDDEYLAKSLWVINCGII